MARKRKFNHRVDVGLTDAWYERLQEVADHPHVNDDLAAVVRDCIMDALPRFEQGLGIMAGGEEVVDLAEQLGVAKGLPEADKDKLVPKPGTSSGWGPDRGAG